MLLAALVACVCPDCSGPCPRTKLPMSTRAPPVSEAEVFALIADFVPTVVVWTNGAADGSTSSAVDWSLTRTTGDAMTVAYDSTDMCLARTGIAIPVVVETNIADGNARQSWATDLEGFGASVAAIELFDEGSLNDDARVDLSDDWEALCAGESAVEGPLESSFLTYNGTFSELTVTVFGRVDGGDVISVPNCWSGTLVGEAGD